MKFKKMLVVLVCICILVVPLSTTVSASFHTKVIYSSNATEISEILNLVKSNDGEKIYNKIYYLFYSSQFAAVYNKTFPYKNNGTASTTVTDNGTVYTFSNSARGCYLYSDYVSKYVYNIASWDSACKSVYITTTGGTMTASQVENTIMTYAQAGEHIRIDSTHSISFIAYTANGFYYMDYATDSDPRIYIRYTTWQQFASECNSYGKWACIYDVDRTTNDISSTVSITSYYEKNQITDTNAILWARVDKPSSYPISKIGIKVRKDGDIYSNGWSRYDNPSKSYVNETYMYIYYDMNDELKATLIPGTKYWIQFYAVVNGKEYWTEELYFYTTGTHTHSYPSKWTNITEATCTTSGTAKRTCTVCGNTETKSVAKLGHKYSTEFTVDIVATCAKKGSKSRHCTRCNAKTDITEIAKSGHLNIKYDWEQLPTENSIGTYVKYCSDCNSTIKNYDIPHMSIESVVFADNKIECRILKPLIDEELSYFVVAMISTAQNDEITINLSEDNGYKIYTVNNIDLLKERKTFSVELWFGAGSIPYSIDILQTKSVSFDDICNDINGDLVNNAVDLVLLRKKLLGINEIRTGDTNADGDINILDLIRLKKHLMK